MYCAGSIDCTYRDLALQYMCVCVCVCVYMCRHVENSAFICLQCVLCRFYSMKRIWWNDSEWKGVGGSVSRLSCHLAIASKESQENHVRLVGCHSSATKRGEWGVVV
jgi:hypothetical protein